MGDRLAYLASLIFHLGVGGALFVVAEVREGPSRASSVRIDYQAVPPPPPVAEPAPQPEPEPEPEPAPEPKKPVRITPKTRVVETRPPPIEPPPNQPTETTKESDPPQAPLYAVSLEATVGESSVAVPVAPRGVPRTRQAKKVVLPDAAKPDRKEPVVTSLPRVVYEARASYPRAAREAGIEGRVLLLITVDSDGSVKQARVLKGLGYGLDQAALVAVRQFRFKPGSVDGNSAPMELRYTYVFVLDD